MHSSSGTYVWHCLCANAFANCPLLAGTNKHIKRVSAVRWALNEAETHPLRMPWIMIFYLRFPSFSLWLSRFVCVCVWRVCACSRPPVRSDLASAARWEPAVRKRPELSGPSAGRPRQKQSDQLRPPAGHAQPWKHVRRGQRWAVGAALADVLHSSNSGFKSVNNHCIWETNTKNIRLSSPVWVQMKLQNNTYYLS